ncbi:unnamed protein product [Nippostrongylus brasiliensis]|uniref:CheW-like domain-containing protein n=1 Tax=Nippostrongylus brasiliensis TaxID=27835 RepID=A0A0N4YR82_NIPBR|nr:unnamed protein product [Nippostrongylus brasiliensis]
MESTAATPQDYKLVFRLGGFSVVAHRQQRHDDDDSKLPLFLIKFSGPSAQPALAIIPAEALAALGIPTLKPGGSRFRSLLCYAERVLFEGERILCF